MEKPGGWFLERKLLKGPAPFLFIDPLNMGDEQMNTNIYSTNDLWLATFLKAKGLKIIRIEGNNRRAVFVFKDTPERKNLIEEFYNNGLVGITLIKNAMADLKSAIFNMD